METISSPTRWDLNSIYGDVTEKSIKKILLQIKNALMELQRSTSTVFGEKEFIILSNCINQIDSLESFYYCLTTEEIESSFLSLLRTGITDLKSSVRMIISDLQDLIGNMEENQFQDWSERIQNKTFVSELSRDGMFRKPQQEKIISSFAIEALRGLEDIYMQIRNNLNVRIDFGDGQRERSFNEANNLAMFHPEYNKRVFAFQELNYKLQEQSNVFASLYNQMVGLRLRENEIKKVDYLEESLQFNGISEATLNAMWNEVDSQMDKLTSYIKIKAKEAGKERLSWHELMTATHEKSFQIPFSKAIEEITKSLETIDIRMAEFVKEAITKGWVDAQQRKAKPSGGFCAPFVAKGESRISLSYDNSIDSARRLAHELGHAWHFKQIKDTPSLRFLDESLEMTMAETSSIFFETAFIDYVFEGTNDNAKKKFLIEWKIERSLNYLMSIRGAFLFEKSFYESRREGQLDAIQMEKLSTQSQKITYGDSLIEYEPFLWMKYGQFYQSDVPFYNYPYTFGFLLSIGLFQMATENKQFSNMFQAFLSETGTLSVEKLMSKHFHIDLSQPDLWKQSIKRVISDIEQYSMLE